MVIDILVHFHHLHRHRRRERQLFILSSYYWETKVTKMRMTLTMSVIYGWNSSVQSLREIWRSERLSNGNKTEQKKKLLSFHLN